MSKEYAEQPEDHLGLLYMVADKIYYKWQHLDMDYEDVVNTTYEYLDRCCRKYDPDKINPDTGGPYRFSTYFVSSALRSQTAIVSKASGSIQSNNNAKLRFARSMLSLQLEFRKGHRGGTLLDMLGDFAENTDYSEAVREILNCVDGMTEAEQDIFHYRMIQGETLAQTGTRVGLTKERVRQVQVNICKHIRQITEAGFCPHLRDFMEGA